MYTSLSSEIDCTCTGLLLHICIRFILDIYLGGSKACVHLALEDIAKHFAKVVIPIYTPSSNTWDFQLLHILNLVGSGCCLFCSVLFVLSHSVGEVVFPCCLNLHFFDAFHMLIELLQIFSSFCCSYTVDFVFLFILGVPSIFWTEVLFKTYALWILLIFSRSSWFAFPIS